MFFGKKERDLVKQVNDELAERVIGQSIAYYPISVEESNFNDIYGEAIDKVSLPPVRVYAYVVVENEQSNDRYGYEYQTKLTVNFHRKRLTADQNLFVRVGDFVQYGDEFYEIVRTYNDTRYYFGQVEHKFQISAECIRARQDAFRVEAALTRPTALTASTGAATAPAPRAAPYPPLDATYITVTANSKLPKERVLTAGSGITITDGGANSALTIAATGQNATGPTGSLQFQTGGGIFSGSANLTFLTASNRLGIATSTPTHNLTVVGSMSASSAIVTNLTASNLISASLFYGDGSNLSGVGGTPGGSTTQVQYNDGSSFQGSSNLTFNGTTLTGSFTGSLAEYTALTSAEITAINITASGDIVLDEDQRIYFEADRGTWIETDSTDRLRFVAGGNQMLLLDQDDKRVNIGYAMRLGVGLGNHTTPSALLHVEAVSADDDRDALFRVDGATAGNVLFVTGSGRVGIGTTDPTYALEVAGDAGFDEYIYHNGDTDTYIRFRGDQIDFVAGNMTFLTLDESAGSSPDTVAVNNGANDIDFQVQGAAQANLIRTDAANDRVGIGTDTPSHLLTAAGSSHLSGGLVHKRTPVASNYTASTADYILGVTSVPVSIEFDATSFSIGQVVVVKDESGAASSANPITLSPSASQTIDGSPVIPIESPYGALLLYSDGTNWYIY